EVRPIDLAIARDARLMPFERMSKDADFVETLAAQFHILGMQMKKLVLKFPERTGRIHVLEHEMRGVIVQPETFARDIIKHAPPDHRTGSQVFAARPFILREEHRAI